MEKFRYIQKVKEVYSNGGNIIDYLKRASNSNVNTVEDIMISYDFQAGTYIKFYYQNKEYYENYCSSLAKVINGLCNFNSIIEIGVGEATTLANLLVKLKKRPSYIYGFDISWSRLKFAKNFLKDFSFNSVKLFTADLFDIPLPDNSFDIVYTSHSIEPNGGKEEAALKELYRITKKYLVLLEPSYEFGNQEAKKRIERLGYVKDLYKISKQLGYKIIEHRLFDYYSNPLNPTALLIIEKNSTNDNNKPTLLCPISRTKLHKYNKNLIYSKESHLAYPVIDNIPCILKDNAILAFHLLTDYENFKTMNNII